jgi:hypothetical protein
VENKLRCHRRRALPINVEILPEVFQGIRADRLPLSRLQQLCPHRTELIVRDSGESRVRQRPLANTRGLVAVPRFHVDSIEIEKVQKGILVELVLDVTVHNVVKEPLGLLLGIESMQQ